jgi:hypothetical protein
MIEVDSPARAIGERPMFDKITQELKVFDNITHILEKINTDGSLGTIHAAFLSIVDNEIIYAMEELLKMEKKNRKLNIRTQLTNNTYIFKENLKSICGILSFLISRSNLEGEDQSEFYQ